MGSRLRPRFYRRRRRRLGESDCDELLGHFVRSPQIDSQANQQRKAEAQLNDGDRGKRDGALPRSCRPVMLRVSGHRRARSSRQR